MHCKEEQSRSKENLQHLNFDISYHSENMHKYATPDFSKKYQPSYEGGTRKPPASLECLTFLYSEPKFL